MIHSYKGPYSYTKKVVSNWNSTAIGVYYCGKLNCDNLESLYIGKGTSESGIRARLLDHLAKDYWSDVTHFGYRICDTSTEAGELEAKEIARCKPKYNNQGK